ncbi:MAG TPA: hypothetical protein VGO92_02460 [Acidimicrobiales bacterium]|nr:hypothetical protein [Acidimicrobiales bacterium]
MYDDAKGYRFGRITYNSPQVSTNMHSLAVSLYRCQTGGRNCSLMDYNFAENSYLPAGKSMTVSTGKVKAQYGWVYQACGGVNATLLSTPPQREWNWGDCTKFIPGAPRVSVIVGPPGV